MLPGIEAACTGLEVPFDVMQHIVRVESSFNPYAIGVVGGRLVRQPSSLEEAVSTARMLESKGYNFSVGLAQVNKHNFARYGLASYEAAFSTCRNLVAGTKILAECNKRAGGDWGKSFSCYYSGNFSTGFRHGYVQKVYASMMRYPARTAGGGVAPIPLIAQSVMANPKSSSGLQSSRVVDVDTSRRVPPYSSESTGLPASGSGQSIGSRGSQVQTLSPPPPNSELGQAVSVRALSDGAGVTSANVSGDLKSVVEKDGAFVF